MLRERLSEITENQTEKQILELINEMECSKKPKQFAIWGAGNTGRQIGKYIKDHSSQNLTPQYVVDNNPSLWGTENIISPTAFFSLEDIPKILLVCVYVADQVVTQIQEAGYKGKVLIFMASMIFDNQEVCAYYDEHMDEIEEIYENLADDQSKQTVEAFLNVTRTGKMDYFTNVNGDSYEKLLDPQILRYTETERMVDVGAFTGDTIQKFKELTENKYCSIVGVEADNKSFETLREYVADCEDGRIRVVNVAMGEKNGELRFRAGYSESSVRSEDGDQIIPMVCLDQFDEVQDATFLKLSANGYEKQIIQGGKELLKRNKPKMAIYASGSELWEIPKLLNELVPEYQIYFRHYGYGRQAMICYARCE